MKKLFTLLVGMCLASVSFAASDYYANYVQLNAYPEGLGKVYVSLKEETPADDQWEDVAELSYVSMYENFYLHAQPVAGYQFAGFSEATFDETETPVFNEFVISLENPFQGDITKTTAMGKDEAEAEANMPLDPNRVYYALFTCVKAIHCHNHDSLGTVAVDKMCNEVGDEITLTATPDLEFDPTCKFDYWIKESTGEKITDNPLKLTVEGVETYKAHFSAEKALVWNFAEEGEFKMWYSESHLVGNKLPDNVWAVSVDVIDSLDTSGKRVCHTKMSIPTHYINYTYTPYIFYGEGEATIVLNGDTNPSIYDGNTFAMAQEDILVDTLTVSSKYYTVDIDAKKFEAIPAGTVISKGTPYARFSADNFLADMETPAVIYWNLEAIPSDIATPEFKEAVKNGKIYNINGMQVTSVGKGIYIMNGKKFIKK